MYDWGSSSMLELLQNGEMNFDKAKEKVGKSQYDSRKGFKDRVLNGPCFTKAVVFVDNSGADILMGIVPFIRYLLGKGTRVILAANSTPCVNDVTVRHF
jgi:type II pantothenate kinase